MVQSCPSDRPILRGIQFGCLPDEVKDFFDRHQELDSQTFPPTLKPVAPLRHILLRLRAEDKGMCHLSPLNRALTSSQGLPAAGSASAATSRRSNSSRWLSGMAMLSVERLSQ